MKKVAKSKSKKGKYKYTFSVREGVNGKGFTIIREAMRREGFVVEENAIGFASVIKNGFIIANWYSDEKHENYEEN